jgi:hypothetical protein
MSATVIVQLPTHILQAVIARLRREGENQDISAAATVVLQQWLTQDGARAGGDPALGYPWKSLFLRPHQRLL